MAQPTPPFNQRVLLGPTALWIRYDHLHQFSALQATNTLVPSSEHTHVFLKINTEELSTLLTKPRPWPTLGVTWAYDPHVVDMGGSGAPYRLDTLLFPIQFLATVRDPLLHNILECLNLGCSLAHLAPHTPIGALYRTLARAYLAQAPAQGYFTDSATSMFDSKDLQLSTSQIPPLASFKRSFCTQTLFHLAHQTYKGLVINMHLSHAQNIAIEAQWASQPQGSARSTFLCQPLSLIYTPRINRSALGPLQLAGHFEQGRSNSSTIVAFCQQASLLNSA